MTFGAPSATKLAALGTSQPATEKLLNHVSGTQIGVGGIYMNMITKSGSNEIHGRLAAYYLTSAFQAEQNLPIYKGQPVQAGTPFVMSRSFRWDQ